VSPTELKQDLAVFTIYQIKLFYSAPKSWPESWPT